ncbi:MAG: MaoC family dehydratase, partial [Burkholderiaceae bacterium]
METDIPAQQSQLLGERAFLAQDLAWFAEVSLDRNPIHTDPVAARRLLTGTQLAHGSHLLLTALELALEQGMIPAGAASLRCNYPNPVSVGDTVRFTASATMDGSVRIDAEVRGLLCCQVTLASALSEAAVTPSPAMPSQGSG